MAKKAYETVGYKVAKHLVTPASASTFIGFPVMISGFMLGGERVIGENNLPVINSFEDLLVHFGFTSTAAGLLLWAVIGASVAYSQRAIERYS